MIYLDHNATTPCCKEATDALKPFLEKDFGNPSSGYMPGKTAADAIARARKEVADLIGANPDSIIFNSGGTESNNTVISGIGSQPCHIIISAIEHPSITAPAIYYLGKGVDVTFAGVDKNGIVDINEIKSAIKPETKLISIMHANNETGVIQPIKEISEIARENNILLHSDAAQSMGKIKVDVNEMGVDFLTIAAHKLYAPKGIGVLYIRNKKSLPVFMHGGGQEGGQRAGTENTPYIAALGAACRVAGDFLKKNSENPEKLRDHFEHLLKKQVNGLVIHGEKAKRLPNTSFVSFPKISGEDLLLNAGEICASTGAACHDGKNRMSHVLKAMDVDFDTARGTIRISTGRHTTMEEIEKAADILIGAWKNNQDK